MRKTSGIMILLILVGMLEFTSFATAQFFPDPGVAGIVSANDVPLEGVPIRMDNLNNGEYREQTTAFENPPHSTAGGYAFCMPAEIGDTMQLTVYYNGTEYYGTTTIVYVDFDDPINWFNLSIDADAPPPSERIICAYVVDTDTSVAISGATVTCNGESENTDADGMAYFTVFPNMYTVTATKTDYQSDSTTVTVGFNDVFVSLYLNPIDDDTPDDPPADPPDDEEEPEDEPEDEPETTFHTLAVIVFDEVTEMPINNASVIIYDPDLNEVSRNNTNESGMIVFQLEEGDYVVVAEKDDYTIKRGAVNLLSSMEYEMIMDAEGLDGSGDFVNQQGIQGQNSSIMYIGVSCIIAIVVIAILLLRWKK